MSPQGVRAAIRAGDNAQIDGVDPLEGVEEIKGVRIYDVGQGDSIAVIDPHDHPVLQVDYGGRQGNPFEGWSEDEIDRYMPVDDHRLTMMTHWDEDHWCSAPKARRVRAGGWLVPRQLTSPRAVKFAAQLDNISCIPEARVGEAFCWRSRLGDEIWWEKIAASEADETKNEDCNKTGVAFSVVKRYRCYPAKVILIPGDAPFDRVRHYSQLKAESLILWGVVAFHHGAKTHWREATRSLLRSWVSDQSVVQTVFSCADPNAFDHPFVETYEELMSPWILSQKTASCRGGEARSIDVTF